MKAVLLDGFGGREVLKIDQIDKPSPGPGQVLIKILATSVNRADIVQRQGNYPPPPGESEILGLEAAGVIEEVGRDTAPWKIGDRVMTLVGGGGCAEFALAWAGHLLPIPKTLTFEQAACVCEVYITAFLNIFLIGEFKDGQSVLIHGGGGGVCTAAIQLCRNLSCDTQILVTASPGKIDRVRQLGADCVINYKEQNFDDEVRRYTANKGVQVILDHVGAEYLTPNLKCLALEGKLIVIGVISGAKAEINLGHLLVKRQQVIGSSLRSRSVEQKAGIVAAFRQRVLPLFGNSTIVPIVDKIFPIERVAEAHQRMEQSQHFGKIVLKLC